MKNIYKYPVEDEVELPVDAEILSVQTQNGQPVFWAIVDSEAKTIKRRFAVVGTGHELEHDGAKFIGTFQLQDELLLAESRVRTARRDLWRTLPRRGTRSGQARIRGLHVGLAPRIAVRRHDRDPAWRDGRGRALGRAATATRGQTSRS